MSSSCLQAFRLLACNLQRQASRFTSLFNGLRGLMQALKQPSRWNFSWACCIHTAREQSKSSKDSPVPLSSPFSLVFWAGFASQFSILLRLLAMKIFPFPNPTIGQPKWQPLAPFCVKGNSRKIPKESKQLEPLVCQLKAR